MFGLGCVSGVFFGLCFAVCCKVWLKVSFDVSADMFHRYMLLRKGAHGGMFGICIEVCIEGVKHASLREVLTHLFWKQLFGTK